MKMLDESIRREEEEREAGAPPSFPPPPTPAPARPAPPGQTKAAAGPPVRVPQAGAAPAVPLRQAGGGREVPTAQHGQFAAVAGQRAGGAETRLPGQAPRRGEEAPPPPPAPPPAPSSPFSTSSQAWAGAGRGEEPAGASPEPRPPKTESEVLEEISRACETLVERAGREPSPAPRPPTPPATPPRRPEKEHRRHRRAGKDGRRHRREGKAPKEKNRQVLGNLDPQRTDCQARENGAQGEAGKAGKPPPPAAPQPERRPPARREEGPGPAGVCPADLLKLRSFTEGPPKELKIRLIKVESGDKETFIASEVEERRLPLAEVTISHSAAEVVRASKHAKVKGKFKESYLSAAQSVKPLINAEEKLPRDKSTPPRPASTWRANATPFRPSCCSSAPTPRTPSRSSGGWPAPCASTWACLARRRWWRPAGSTPWRSAPRCSSRRTRTGTCRAPARCGRAKAAARTPPSPSTPSTRPPLSRSRCRRRKKAMRRMRTNQTAPRRRPPAATQTRNLTRSSNSGPTSTCPTPSGGSHSCRSC
ncbi:unnamed protein product [Caretta caretta]